MEEKVKKILAENRPDIEDLDNALFVEDGMLDSFDIVTLVAEFDKEFNISIDGADITPDNFNTVTSIVAMLKKNGAK